MAHHEHHEHHEHHDHEDPATLFTQETWDARYAESERVWSGRPNQRLVEQVAGLTPGSAADVGCGEGADAVWLAEHGWDVTALDVSEVALSRAREHAEEAGVAARVRILHHDLVGGGGPLPGRYDLVSVFFFHVLPEAFDGIYRGLADAVAPGGTLLVVGHHPEDHESGVRRPHGGQLLFTPDQVVALLDPEEWTVVTQDDPQRVMATADGEITVRDSVVRAIRR